MLEASRRRMVSAISTYGNFTPWEIFEEATREVSQWKSGAMVSSLALVLALGQVFSSSEPPCPCVFNKREGVGL